jgi:hypothetical protein
MSFFFQQNDNGVSEEETAREIAEYEAARAAEEALPYFIVRWSVEDGKIIARAENGEKREYVSAF